MYRNRTKQNGFTLLEILIAMVILAVGLLALSSMQGNFAAGNAKGRQLTRAMNLASSQVENMTNTDFDNVNNGTRTVTVNNIDYRIRWYFTNASTNWRQFTVTTSYDLGNRNHSVSLEWMKVRGL